MRAVFAILLVLCVSTNAAAQTLQPPSGIGRITGLVSTADGQRLNAAAITVRSADDAAVVAGALTDGTGRFGITGLAAGNYIVRISLIGYEPAVVERVSITIGKPTVDVGIVRLSIAAVAVRAVEATSQRSPIVMEADRMVYNARDIIAADGGTAADLLRQIDELEVDLNGRVTLRGNQTVAIHINGRPAPMKADQLQEFLKHMPAKSISKVEVIPNPSAKYDPEGMGGIVNIVLRDDASLGLSGSAGINANTRGALGTTARIAYQKGKLTFFGGGTASISDSEMQSFDLRQSLTPGSTAFERSRFSNGDNLVGFGDFSAEYKLRSHTTVWLNGYASSHEHDTSARILTNVGSDFYAGSSDSETPHSFIDWGVGVKRVFGGKRHELIVDMRRSNNTASTYSELDSSDGLIINSGDEGFGALTLRADYTRPWGKSGDLAAGIQLVRRDVDETSVIDHEHTSGESAFTYEELLNALYLTASRVFGRLTVGAGMRGEFAQTNFAIRDGEDFDNRYNSVFPNLNVAYQIDKARTLRAGYAKRVGRPPTHLLNPYRVPTDPSNRMQGNPFLGPNYTHTLNLDYSVTGRLGTLRVGPYLRRTVQSWEEIKSVDTSGVLTTTWQNSASIRQIGSSFTLSMPAQSRIGGSLNFAVFHSHTDATNLAPDFDRSSLRWSTGTNVTAKINELLIASANLNYMAPRDLPQGRQKAMVNSFLGLRQQLLSKNATLNLMFSDPLNLHGFEMETRDSFHVQRTRMEPHMRALSVSFTYNFGRPPKQESRRETEMPVTN